MFPSTKTNSDKKTAKLAEKLVRSVAQIDEFMSKMKAVERLNVMMTKSLGIMEARTDKKPKIVILIVRNLCYQNLASWRLIICLKVYQ